MKYNNYLSTNHHYSCSPSVLSQAISIKHKCTRKPQTQINSLRQNQTQICCFLCHLLFLYFGVDIVGNGNPKGTIALNN